FTLSNSIRRLPLSSSSAPYVAIEAGSWVKERMRTSPFNPWARPISPSSSLSADGPKLLGSRLLGLGLGGRSRSGRSLGRGLRLLGLGGGLRFLAFDPLLAGLGLVGVGARGALGEAGLVEEAQHPIGGLGADADPMLHPLLDQRHALGGVA